MTLAREDEALSSELMAQLPEFPEGIRYRILYFMRTIDCPSCRFHVKRLAQVSATLRELSTDVVVFAPEAGGNEGARWIASQPFPVLATDQAHSAAGLSRILFGSVQQSGTLVIAVDGRLVLARRATLPFKAFDERELMTTLRAVAPVAAP